ncbi:hypothetical protein CC78DRAFT_540474 [Lojkania enalia]|uniref:Uncharacterized protein n=1 Tax=Lojkania enalia TaxID=147567 RepID=A0A9P4N9E1_9PLEO|nr:hypothetical protein CC78DRAFT_540474 [Didymosphaeria enalia]
MYTEKRAHVLELYRKEQDPEIQENCNTPIEIYICRQGRTKRSNDTLLADLGVDVEERTGTDHAPNVPYNIRDISELELIHEPLSAKSDGKSVCEATSDCVELDIFRDAARPGILVSDPSNMQRPPIGTVAEAKNGATAYDGPRKRKPIARVIKSFIISNHLPKEDNCDSYLKELTPEDASVITMIDGRSGEVGVYPARNANPSVRTKEERGIYYQ